MLDNNLTGLTEGNSTWPRTHIYFLQAKALLGGAVFNYICVIPMALFL